MKNLQKTLESSKTLLDKLHFLQLLFAIFAQVFTGLKYSVLF